MDTNLKLGKGKYRYDYAVDDQANPLSLRGAVSIMKTHPPDAFQEISSFQITVKQLGDFHLEALEGAIDSRTHGQGDEIIRNKMGKLAEACSISHRRNLAVQEIKNRDKELQVNFLASVCDSGSADGETTAFADRWTG
ncbi:hypothetical protein SADUNF_Sadunf16G0105400 [Salix dunnii]|uniref:Uncharacterized protein n=1 Tax=Salix dunnii TaxID=1413687 RepID=A0A835MPW6_9ROSI|nr:hypothetical protein SADUNF_Sadunf16G0105400 [Salix dunnii]